MGDSQVSTRVVAVEAEAPAAVADACLVVLYPPESPHFGRRTPLRDGLSIGRDPDNDLVLSADCVSRQHCRFEQVRAGWRIVDCGSKNGTRMGGLEVRAALVEPGVELKIGDTILKVLSGAEVEAQFLETVYRLAVEDPLTGLDNRRALVQALERELPRARRYRHALSLLMIDVDRFKEINEAIGHVSADVVLQELARVLRHRLRAGDVLARLGGDELAVLLPEADLVAARRVAGDLAAVVKGAPFDTPRGSVAVTISVGVAELGPDMDPADLLEAADARLFAAKRAGKDRVAG